MPRASGVRATVAFGERTQRQPSVGSRRSRCAPRKDGRASCPRWGSGAERSWLRYEQTDAAWTAPAVDGGAARWLDPVFSATHRGQRRGAGVGLMVLMVDGHDASPAAAGTHRGFASAEGVQTVASRPGGTDQRMQRRWGQVSREVVALVVHSNRGLARRRCQVWQWRKLCGSCADVWCRHGFNVQDEKTTGSIGYRLGCSSWIGRGRHTPGGVVTGDYYRPRRGSTPFGQCLLRVVQNRRMVGCLGP